MTKTAEAKWRRLVEEQKESGESVQRFAAERGLSAATLYWWRSRLRRAEQAHLVPVEVIDTASPVGQAGFELELRDAVRLRIPPGFDSTDLRRLLHVLAQPC